MRSLLALSMTVLGAVGLASCGGAGTGSSSTTQTPASVVTTTGSAATTTGVPPGSYLHLDGDTDNDDTSHPSSHLDDDKPLLDQYGHHATDADKQAVTAVVKSYYAAAAAEEAAKACSLLYSSLASGLAPTPGQGAGPAAQGTGKTCADGVPVLYKHQHDQLVADDVATMVVTDVRLKGNLGLAVLGFRTKPEGEILVERERGTWKVDALFDSQIP
jgi:hypothetical protein